MLVFISGGVRSGKSSLGEKLAVSLASKNRKIYLATARHYDKEITRRIQLHQQNRAGKSFLTIDKSWDLGETIANLEAEDTVIVDCLGTLLANEMFERPEPSNTSNGSSARIELSNPVLIRDKIFADLSLIQNKVANLIIISNEIFNDGIQYAKSTETYIQTLAELHIKLAVASDVSIECVYYSYQCHKGNEILTQIEDFKL